MRRRRSRFSYRPRRRNLGDQLMAMLNPPDAGIGVLSGVQPRNMIAVLPILGGAIANGYVRGQLIPSLGFMPKILKSGLGNYLLGVGTSGVIGAIAGYFDYGIGQSMFVGGVSETAISAFAEGYAKRSKGFDFNGVFAPLKPNLGDFGIGEELEGCEGYGCGEEIEGLGVGQDDSFNLGLGPDDRFSMGDFVTPGQITSATEMPSQAGQYPMPAQIMQPMPQGAVRRGPRMANTDDLEQGILGELIRES